MTIDNWAFVLLAGLAAVVGGVVAVQRWAKQEFVTRAEYHIPCTQPCDVIRREYMPRVEIERELQHRSDRTHEVANNVQTLSNRIYQMERELTVLGIITRNIAKNLGVEVPNQKEG